MFIKLLLEFEPTLTKFIRLACITRVILKNGGDADGKKTRAFVISENKVLISICRAGDFFWLWLKW